MTMRQTSLSFAEPPEVGATTDTYAGLNWSYSRRESLEHCTRRYFLQYYSATLADSALKERVRFLRAVKNRYLRTGELVHLVIGTYFKKLKQGKTLSADWLTRWVKSLLLEDKHYTAHIRGGGAPSNQQYPPVILDEILSEVDDHAMLLAQAEEQMVSAIQNFFAAPVFAEFQALGASPDAHIERKLSLAGFPAPVSGKVDLAGKNDGKVTIVDWKIGSSSDGGAESLQLATYGIWATTELAASEDNLRIVKAHLASKEVVEFHADQQAFTNARVRILQDLERMVILHQYGRSGVIEAFTPNPHAGVCRLCPFREICPEGKAVIHA